MTQFKNHTIYYRSDEETFTIGWKHFKITRKSWRNISTCMRYTLLKKHKKQRTLNNLFIEWKAMKRWKHKVSIDQPLRLRNIDHTDQFSYSTQILCLTFGSECSTIIRNSWKNRQCIHSTSSSVASVFSHSKKTPIVHIIVLDFQLLVETNINKHATKKH